MNVVLFPSAKLITRDLQNIGRLPAIIYPIDQMCMFDLFYDYYFIETNIADKFEIVAYEAYEQVIQRIGGKKNIHITKLDKIKDLGYTVLYGIRQAGLNDGDTLVINFADVAELRELKMPLTDRCYYAKEDLSSKWAYFKEENGVITECYDKPENISRVDTSNILIGLFHIAKPGLLEEMLERAVNEPNAIDSLWIALQRYSAVRPFDMIYAENWFDIGHIDKYYATQIAIKSRTFNHITIDRSRGILTKTSDDKEKFIGEIRWYLKLPTEVEYIRPRIFSYSLNYSNPYVSMEYYSYHTLHELFLFGDLSEEQWNNVFRRIRFILNDFRRYSVKDGGIREALEEMYITKTLSRLKQMRKAPDFLDFDDSIEINGVSYLPLSEISELLTDLIKRELLDIDEFNIIHGDLCFSNIMIDPNYSFIKLIDPRGKFGKYDIYGDWRYELAKLMHSIDGKYDYIIKDRFDINVCGNTIFYSVRYKQAADIVKCFNRIFEEEIKKRERQIKLIESLLFFSMIPLHKESQEQQLAMLTTAILVLDGIANIRMR